MSIFISPSAKLQNMKEIIKSQYPELETCVFRIREFQISGSESKYILYANLNKSRDFAFFFGHSVGNKFECNLVFIQEVECSPKQGKEIQSHINWIKSNYGLEKRTK